MDEEFRKWLAQKQHPGGADGGGGLGNTMAISTHTIKPDVPIKFGSGATSPKAAGAGPHFFNVN